MSIMTTTKVQDGQYTVRPGDDFTKVALLLFGNRRKATDIARANPDATWEPGSTLTIPGKGGTLVQVPSEETQFPTLWRMVFKTPPNAGGIKEFQRWNGGDVHVEPGSFVFFPAQRPVSYGY